MNGVLGMTGLLLDTQLTPEQREYSEAAHVSATHLLELLNEILDYSKIEAGRLQFEDLPFDVGEALDDVVYLLRGKAAEKGLELLPHYRLAAGRWVRGDPGRVRQIVTNLLGNALKFTPQGSVALTVQSRVEGARLHLEIAVRDTGIGIAPEALEHIFEVFTQADASTTRRFGGSGLGLAISRQLARAMGGELTVESTLGVGSTFTARLVLPRAPEADRPRPSPGLVDTTLQVLAPPSLAREQLVEQLRGLGLAPEVYDEPSARRSAPPPCVIIAEGPVDAPSASRVQWARPGPRGGPPESSTLTDAVLLRPTRDERLLALLESLVAVARKSSLPPRGSDEAPSELRGRVLLVEDNAINQKVAMRMLERLDVRVDVAGNGREALEMVARLPYDLVLMDCQMPELDGFQATEQIRRMSGRSASSPSWHSPPTPWSPIASAAWRRHERAPGQAAHRLRAAQHHRAVAAAQLIRRPGPTTVERMRGSSLALLLALASTSALAEDLKLDGHRIVLPAPLVFEAGRAEPSSPAPLGPLVAHLAKREYITLVRVEGHVAGVAPAEAQALSAARALAVARALVAQGVDCKRLLPVAFGDTKPVADNKTPAGRAQNTRIELHNATLRGRAIGGMPVDGGGQLAGDPCS
jgi:CheY-like chemotaxis protein